MALTREFKETLMLRARRDVKFRRALLKEAVEAFLSGDLETGKSVLRDYINATVTFEGLARSLGKESKSLHRMLGPKGNPTAENIFAVIKALQDAEDVHFQVRTEKTKAA